MSKYWNYAELSKLAKAAGGPDAFVDAIKRAGYLKGFAAALAKGRWQGVLIGGVCVLGVEAFLYTLYYFLVKEDKKKSEMIEAEKDAEVAEEILINELEKFEDENRDTIVDALKSDGIDVNENDSDGENLEDENPDFQSSKNSSLNNHP